MRTWDEASPGILFCRLEPEDEAGGPIRVSELQDLLRKEPELRAGVRSLRKELVLCGDDELQIEEACTRIEAGSNVKVGPLQVALLETIRKAAEGEGKYIRQTGGSGNYGHAKVFVQPNEPGQGYEFINEIKGGTVPKEYIEPIDHGVQDALEVGILAGYPMVDVTVTLYDGSYHEVDSNEMAFKIAGSIALQEAARNASPVLLEPVMAVEMTVPAELIGTTIRDIKSRRGRIESADQAVGSQVIKGVVPLAEALRSSFNGRPKYAMRFAGYEPRRLPGEPFGEASPLVKTPSKPSSRSSSAAAEFDN